jgi:hypothetical protein
MNWGAFAVQVLREWAPFSEETRNRRAANKRARRIRKGKCICDAELADEYCPQHGTKVLSDDTKETETMNGFKTYTGIAIALLGVVLGWLGVGESDSAALSAQIVGAIDQLLTVGGLAFAAYGRAKAQPK